MTRLSHEPNPIEVLEERLQLFENFMRSNPLNSAAVDGRVRLVGAGSIEAGQSRMDNTGLWMPFDGQSTSVSGAMGSVRGQALDARRIGQDAYALADSKPTKAYVDGEASRLQQNINEKPTWLYVDTRLATKLSIDYVDGRDASNSQAASRAQSSANTAMTRADAAFSLANSKPTKAYVDGEIDSRASRSAHVTLYGYVREQALAINELAVKVGAETRVRVPPATPAG